jgi:hypothetical protein
MTKKNLTDASDFEPVQSAAPAVPAAFDEPAPAVPQASPAAPAPTEELTEADGIAVPQLLGKTVREVTQMCLKLGLTPVLVGTGIATEQSPEPGAIIRRGNRITVQFARDASLLSAAARGKVK